MKAVVFTLGCKVNEVESRSVMSSLEEMGFETSDRLEYADIFILNTCAVTAEAEKKSRQLISRARKFNPDADIFVCGCASEKDKKSFEEKGAVFVTGARRKQDILKAVSKRYGRNEVGLLYPKKVKSRSFIKIQDGCNNFCSYCIIPYLRGREVSRAVSDIVTETERTAGAEIVLNGINISSFGGGLTNLIKALSHIKKRIRLGSLECNVIDGEFLTSLKNLYDFAPQFHLSLQSGSNAVLKSMNRRYTREEYLEKCVLIYKYFPEAAITTDIIAGFATETESDFSQSLSIIDEAGFARVHAFMYSPREGTAAFKLKDLPYGVKKQRLDKLIIKSSEAAEKFAGRFIGTFQKIIAEEFSDGYSSGYTGNYIKVYVNGKLNAGEIYGVKLIKLFKDGVLGEISE